MLVKVSFGQFGIRTPRTWIKSRIMGAGMLRSSSSRSADKSPRRRAGLQMGNICLVKLPCRTEQLGDAAPILARTETNSGNLLDAGVEEESVCCFTNSRRMLRPM